MHKQTPRRRIRIKMTPQKILEHTRPAVINVSLDLLLTNTAQVS